MTLTPLYKRFGRKLYGKHGNGGRICGYLFMHQTGWHYRILQWMEHKTGRYMF